MRTGLLALPLAVLAACGGGGGGNNNTPPPPPSPPPPPQSSVQVSGTVNYEFVPVNAAIGGFECPGLNFNATQVRPIRGATVQLIDATSGGVLGTTVSAASGAYSFANIAADTMVRLRVRAELKRSGIPAWDVEVRDNVDTSASPPPLATRPLYTLDGTSFSTGTADVVRNVTAQTGWGVNSYTGARAAAPFAILDAIYTAIQFNLAADPNLVYPPMDVFWSVDNTDNTSQTFDIDSGELGTSFYAGSIDSLFILGDANSDADEFDDNVVVHEYGHFFDDNFLRTESPGGRHALGDKLDARLAFNEGWPTAYAGMALNEERYCDTSGPSSGFGVNAEGGAFGGQGWYDEVSVIRFLYDLWDTTSEGTDTGSIGFEPIYETFVNEFRFSDALGTLFSFAGELRPKLDPAGQALLDAQLGDEQTMGGPLLSIWGDGETNDGNPPTNMDVLPLYLDYTADGTPLEVCSNDQFDPDGDGNKLSQDRYLRITVPQTGQYDVTVQTTTQGLPTPSDPDIQVYRTYLRVGDGRSPAADLEQFRTSVLQQGLTYAAIVEDWRFDDPDKPFNYPGRVCMDVTFNLVP